MVGRRVVAPAGVSSSASAATKFDGNVATLEVYDRGPADPHQPCILIAALPAREVELQLDEPGEATIRLIGRRVQGQGDDQYEMVERIEKPVVVR